MKAFEIRATFAAVLLLAWLLIGCATQKVNWASRVGTYTFDQAITEIGPPDKQAKLTDGTIVAEWLTQRGYRQTYLSGGYHRSPWFYGPYPPTYYDSYSSPDYFLRLNFAPDGKLQSWKQFAR